MEEYIILVILIFLLGFFFLKKRKKTMLFLISTVLVFFAGFRYNVGVDYPNYVKIFDGVRYYDTREIGFKYFVDFLHYLGVSSQMMFLLLAIVMQILVYKIILYYSSNYWFSIVIFLLIPPFYLETFNGIRQSIATGFFLYSLQFIEQKKLKHYFISNIICAFFFHESILFVMFLFPIINKNFSIKNKIFILLGVFVFNLFLDLLISYTPYANYLEIDKKVEISSFTYILFFSIALMVLFEKKLPDFKHRRILLNLNYFSLLTLFLVLIQSKDVLIQMFMRFNNYFFFGFIILIPNLVMAIKNHQTRLVSYIFIIGFSLYYFFITLINSGKHYNLTPYLFNFKLF